MWAHPKPHGNTMTRVQYVTSDVAYAVTDGGTVVKSIDGGKTWGSLYSVLDVEPVPWGMLHGLSFVDQNTGWVVGWEGQVSMTTDGGQTWTDRSANTTRKLRDAHFFDANNGFVVGDGGDFFRTSDGGMTWNAVTNPNTSGDDLYVIVFPTPSLGWAGGENGTLMITSDGGDTWTMDQGLAMHIHHACPVGTNAAAFAGGNIVGVVRTSGPNSGETLGTAVGGVSFSDENTGYATYSDATGRYVARTKDGGNTWTSTLMDDFLALIDVAVIGDRAIVVGEDGIFYWSADGGQNWTSGLSGHYDNDVSRVMAVGMGDAMHGVAAGFGGGIYRTADGGESWEFVNSGVTSDLRGVWMVGSDLAFAVGEDTTALRSTDGGLTWSQMTLPTTSRWLYAVSMWDANNGVIVGSDIGGTGTIMVTSDGGDTWTHENAGSLMSSFLDVYTVGTDHLWIAARDGQVVHSPDHGNAWIGQDLGTTHATESIMFVDENNGWATTNLGVHYTHDGGDNWTLVTGFPGSVNDVHFATPEIGIASMNQARIARSEDGGETWTTLHTGVQSWSLLLSAWMTSETDAVVVGAESIMLYTRTGGLAP